MAECLFCEIAGGKHEQSSRIFRESDLFIALLASHPKTRGHFLVIPKRHAGELDDMKDIAGKFMETIIAWAGEAIIVLGAKAYVLKLNNNMQLLDDDPLRQVHTHMHVMPFSHKGEEKSREELTEGTDEYFREMVGSLGIG